jgi:SAM-dependent methyltransferase
MSDYSFNEVIFKSANEDSAGDENVREFWKTSPKDFENDDYKFVDWFDQCESLEASWRTGYLDFFYKILSTDIMRIVGDPTEKTALEIGFGSGRLLNASTSVFKKVYGVDIHDSFKKVEKLVLGQKNKSKKSKNFELLNESEFSKVPDNQVDFCYSFIVFQHFHSLDTFKNYLSHLKRVLNKENGCGIIYMGMNVENKNPYIVKGMEGTEGRGHGGSSTLLFKPEYALSEFSKYFEVLEGGLTSKKPWLVGNPETGENLSSQFYIKFKSKES